MHRLQQKPKFGLRKKKKKKKKKASQTYLYTVCSCAPSFAYRRKSGKSLEEEKNNSSSQWVWHITIYLFLCWRPASYASLKRASAGSESEGWGGVGVACRLGNGNQVCITTGQNAAKLFICFALHRSPFPFHR
uniref:Uncharacterized protein n=1 Tax=Pipistrellus kuhlii TaxID=59472 RepID=A0A7J7W2X1_PIPKU|nr:hypothetical protein mPipKuh1_008127 [Pipistrellus kuhlii]